MRYPVYETDTEDEGCSILASSCQHICPPSCFLFLFKVLFMLVALHCTVAISSNYKVYEGTIHFVLNLLFIGLMGWANFGVCVFKRAREYFTLHSIRHDVIHLYYILPLRHHFFPLTYKILRHLSSQSGPFFLSYSAVSCFSIPFQTWIDQDYVQWVWWSFSVNGEGRSLLSLCIGKSLLAPKESTTINWHLNTYHR